MVKDPPFDAWDGEDLETIEVAPDDAAEEVAMHITDGSDGDPASWSDLTDDVRDVATDDRPVTYFDDEQPELSAPDADVGERPEPDLEELLERQHYAFPQAD